MVVTNELNKVLSCLQFFHNVNAIQQQKRLPSDITNRHQHHTSLTLTSQHSTFPDINDNPLV